MPVIVDTYNVLHTTGVLPPELAGVDLAGLAVLIRSSRYAREQVTLVCDGYGTENPIDETRFLQVAFAGLGRTADDLIAELVERSSAPRLLLVVSSDNQVLRSAKRRGSRRMTASQFLQHLADDAHAMPRADRPAAKPPAPVPDDEVDRWIEHFELSEDEMSQPAAFAPKVERREQPKSTSNTPSRPTSAGDPTGAEVTGGDSNAHRHSVGTTSGEEPPDAPAQGAAGDVDQFPLLSGGLPDSLIREAESLWNRHASDRGDA